MANAGNPSCARVTKGGTSGDAPARGVNHVGSVLCRRGDCFLRSDVELYESFGASLRKVQMEYVIAGITAIFLFIYLMYALLRPERF